MVELSDEQAKRVREAVDTVETPAGGTKRPHLHIPSVNCRVSRNDDVTLYTKDVAVFPLGYREWCPECLRDGPVDIDVETCRGGVDGDLG